MFDPVESRNAAERRGLDIATIRLVTDGRRDELRDAAVGLILIAARRLHQQRRVPRRGPP